MTAFLKEFHAHLARMPIVAILRGITPDEAEDVGRALLAAGIRIVEVPLNSPSAYDSIAKLVEVIPESAGMVGAGTVLTASEVDHVRHAGGQLIVSPNMDVRVIRETKRVGLVSAPGVMTPTEAFAALEAGADVLKLFPGEAISPSAVKAMRAVLPREVKLLAVGGINAHNVAEYKAAGASGFGAGGSIYAPGMSAPDVFKHAGVLVRAILPEA